MKDLRRVTVEECPFYQSDNGAGQYKFKVKRQYFDKDLSTLTAYLKIRFQDESTDKILLSNATSDDDWVTVTFVVSDVFSRVAGKAKCQLCFENTDGSVVINTEVFTVDIMDSVEVESYGQTVLPSAIRLLQTKLQEKIDEMNQKITEVNNSVSVVKIQVSSIGFNNKQQTFSVPSAKEDSVIVFSPLSNQTAVKNAGLYISSQGTGTVTLSCTNQPSADFLVQFAVINKIPTAE